jgi:ceramide synthetase
VCSFAFCEQLKKRLKKKRLSSVEIKLQKQSKWGKFVSRVVAMSATGDREGGVLEVAQLNAWWGVIKRDSARSLEIQKFNEAFWRASFYTFIWCYGIWVGWRESWLMDMRAIWGGWPLEQQASTEVRWYYFLSMGHYIHLFVTQFFEPRRKDWWEMFIHHIVTMLLLFFSYLVNFVRIGTVVLLCHDGSDIFLELAKLFNYMKMGALCDATFVVFALAFFVGRLVLYPWRVVYVAVVLGAEQVGVWRGFYIFVGLLLVLQVLHLFWFYTIVCMVWAFAATGGVEKDVREETESEPEETTDGAPVPAGAKTNVLEAAKQGKAKAEAAQEGNELRQRAQQQQANDGKKKGK